MDVVVNVGGKVVVDDVLDVGDIETTSSDGGGDEDRGAARTEHLEGALTLTLSAVTVNGGGREALVDEEVGEGVGHALGLDEDQGKTCTVGVKDVEQHTTLVHVLHVLDLLGDVLRGGTNAANRQEDVVAEEVAGEHLDVTGEGGGKHECLAAVGGGHVLTLDNATDLGLETHVKHAVSLVENQVLDVLERDAATLDQVDKTTGGSDKQVTATLDLAELGANVGTTVDDARADPRAVGELAGLVEDLRDKLTGGSEDEGGRVSLALAGETRLGRGVAAGAVLVGLGEDGEEETASLSGTGLSASHEVTAAHDDGDGVFLDGSRDLVASQVDVADEVVIERRVGEDVDGLGNALTGSLDGDVIVFLEVDTSLLLAGRVGRNAKEFALNALVGRAGHVLAVDPASIARATVLAAASAAAGCAAVSVAVKTTATTGRAGGAARLKVGGAAPAAARSTVAVVWLAIAQICRISLCTKTYPGPGP